MELKEKLEKIDALKAELDALGPLDPDAKERLAQKVRMEWNFHSNVIEGNELTYGETRSLLISGITANGKSLKDHQDMKGHNEALKKLEKMAAGEIRITENLIREFHEIILVDPYKDNPDVLVGEYKRTSNYLYNDQGERVDFVPVEEVPEKLNELINWTNNAIFLPKRKRAKYETHPLLIATLFHMRFINIHPFDDGNGRICRIMMNIILLQCGFPPIIIQNDQRKAYFRAIQRAREEGEELLGDFLADELIRSLELYLKAAKGEPIEESDDLDKEVALLKLRLTEKPDLEKKKEPEVIQAIYNDSIKPIFERLHNKLTQFDDLFLDKESWAFVNNSHQGSKADKDPFSYLESQMAKNKRIMKNMENVDEKSAEFVKLMMEQPNLDSLSYKCTWSGFKKAGLNAFNVTISLNFEFTEFSYRYSGRNDNLLKEKTMLYHERMTTDEMDRIVSTYGRYVLNEIKKKAVIDEE